MLSPLNKLILPDMFVGRYSLFTFVVLISLAIIRDVLGCIDVATEDVPLMLPGVELLCRHHYAKRNGVGVIVLVPSREEAIAITKTVNGMMTAHPQKCGMVIESANFTVEADKLCRGINFLVATPKRLLDHMKV
jgi:ATP-dependent RNA helicase DDX18/HAS1